MLSWRESVSPGKKVMFYQFLRNVLLDLKTLKMNFYHCWKDDSCNAYCFLVLKWKSNSYSEVSSI